MAALFVRLLRSLDALTGSNETQSRAWLNSENLALNGPPRHLLTLAMPIAGRIHPPTPPATRSHAAHANRGAD